MSNEINHRPRRKAKWDKTQKH